MSNRLEMFCGDRPYSSRRASVGLTFEARHAGMKAAARAPAARTIAAAAMVAGSVGVTPNNCDWTSLPRAVDARERDGQADGDHDDGVAQDESDGGSARGAKRETDAD